MEMMVYVIECYNTEKGCIEQCGMSLSKEIAIGQMELIECRLRSIYTGIFKKSRIYTDYRVSEYKISDRLYTEFLSSDEED